MRYHVVVSETTHLTYDIEAESPKKAREIWENTASDELNDPDEDLIGGEVIAVYEAK